MLTTAGAASSTAAASPGSTARANDGAAGQTAAPIANARTINLCIWISIFVTDLREPGAKQWRIACNRCRAPGSVAQRLNCSSSRHCSEAIIPQMTIGLDGIL
jgi:hypothetical protein